LSWDNFSALVWAWSDSGTSEETRVTYSSWTRSPFTFLPSFKRMGKIEVWAIKKECCAARVWQNSLERCFWSSSQSVPYLTTCEVTLLLVLFFFCYFSL
jgi:hypothetical protein